MSNLVIFFDEVTERAHDGNTADVLYMGFVRCHKLDKKLKVHATKVILAVQLEKLLSDKKQRATVKISFKNGEKCTMEFIRS